MTIKLNRSNFLFAAVKLTLASMLISAPVAAQEDSFQQVWKYANLYQSKQGNFFKLSGRLQADAAYFDASQDNYSDVLWRRFRFGFKGKYGRITAALEADLDLNKSLSNSYKRLTDANLSWQINKNLKIKVLKQSTGFTLDGKTSSKKLLTPQRSNLSNNLWFTAEYFSGVSLKGKLSSNWSYNTGLFSSDGSDEIGFADASYFMLFSTEKSLPKTSIWEKAELGLDYVYNDVDEKGNTKKFTHVVSFSSKFSQGKWHLWNDIAMGQGDLGQSDLWGLTVMPFYQQSKNLQWVTRYTYLDSDSINGIKLGRYEKEIISGKGDKYQELYAGVNYYFYGHKLKVQAGTQYTKMDDSAKDGGKYNGWGVTLGLRSYW